MDFKVKRFVKNHGYYSLPKFFRAHLYFIYRYYFRLGFLDGTEGKIYTFLQAYWYRYLVDAKSLTWSSVLLAFEKTEGKPLVERPKALGDIRGVAYIYGMFYRFGLIEVPVKQDEPRSDPTS